MKNKQAKWEKDLTRKLEYDLWLPSLDEEDIPDLKAFIFRVEKTSYAEGYREALRNVEKLLPYGVSFTDKFYALKKKVEEK